VPLTNQASMLAGGYFCTEPGNVGNIEHTAGENTNIMQ